ELPQAGVDGLALVEAELERPQPLQPCVAEDVRDRRPALEAAQQHGVDLVLRPGRLFDQLATPGDEPTQQPRPLVTDPDARDKIRCQQLGQRAGIDRVRLHLRLRDRPHLPRMPSTTSATCGARIPAIASASPVASITTLSSAPRLCANSSNSAGRVATRPALRAFPPSEIATSQKSRYTPKPMNRIRCLLSRLALTRETRRANDTHGSVLAAHPGKSQGRPGTPTGSQPIRTDGLPDLRSPSKPLFRNQSDATGRAGRPVRTLDR